MDRLTVVDDLGNLGMKGFRMQNIYPGSIIGYSTSNALNEALERLAEYEDTGLSPEQIYQMDEMYSDLSKKVEKLKRTLKYYKEKKTELEKRLEEQEWQT